jgi:hypothetical protein
LADQKLLLPVTVGAERGTRTTVLRRRAPAAAATAESDAGVLHECANQSTFFMYLSDGAGTSRAICAFWSVTNIEQEVVELKERGVTFERYQLQGMTMDSDIATGGGTKAAWFKDPAGNIHAADAHRGDRADPRVGAGTGRALPHQDVTSDRSAPT